MSDDPMYSSPEQYWGSYRPKAGQDRDGGVPSADRMHWTQYPGHGPGAEFVGTPATALEIGSATCVAGVALARTGVAVTCVDYSPVQMERARRWWGEEPNVELVDADVLAHLGSTVSAGT